MLHTVKYVIEILASNDKYLKQWSKFWQHIPGYALF